MIHTEKVRALRTIKAHGMEKGDKKELPTTEVRSLVAWGWVERVQSKSKAKKTDDKPADET